MSEITNAEINKDAAIIAGHTEIRVHNTLPNIDRVEVIAGTCDRYGDIYEPFDIFTSPADREAVVIALGEKHGIYLYPHFDVMMGYFRCWNVRGSCTHQTEYDAYIEALSAAVQAVK